MRYKISTRMLSPLVGLIMLSGCAPDQLFNFTKDKKKGGSSCQSYPSNDFSNADFGIVNGQETAEHPAVVFLVRQKPVSNGRRFAVCTGTFVGSNVLLTAAHCIDDTPNGGVSMFQGPRFDLGTLQSIEDADQFMATGIPATSVLHQGLTENELMDEQGKALNYDKTYMDFAILLFPPGSAPATVPIAQNKPAAKTRGVIIGYGMTSRDGNGEPLQSVKRQGPVMMSPTQRERGLLTLASKEPQAANELPPSGSFASTAQGDSGGPMLVNNEIVGVSSSGAESDAALGHLSFYVDLNSSESRKLIERARTSGAQFVGGPGSPNSQTLDPQTPNNCQ